MRSFQLVLKTATGTETIEGEILHTGATTCVAPNEEFIGTDFSPPRACQLKTCVARFDWNGDIEWDMHVRERITRINTLH